jgi:hypothetical protein
MLKASPRKVLAFVILLAASLNLASQFYRMHQSSVERQRMYDQGFGVGEYFGPSTDERMQICIEPFLIILFVGSCLKRLKGVLLSVVGLAGATFFYLFWWQYYFRMARLTESESELRSIRHLAYLYNGNYLDIGIAILLALLIVMYVWWALESVFRRGTAHA